MDSATSGSILLRGTEGVAEWNYRRATGEVHPPKLRGADLSGADLTGANLSYVDFENAKLEGATFVRADLYRTGFAGAHLKGSNFAEARLHETNLSAADLREARFFRATVAHVDFRNANLEAADFTEAWLIGGHFAKASLKDAIFGYTYLSSVLRDASGINDIRHTTRSRLALDTVLFFEELPEQFLRGCGIEEEDLAYFRGRAAKPLQFYSAFISYSHSDRLLAERLHANLQSSGIRCWLDAHDLMPGDRILDAVDQAIRVHDRVLLCCSRSSLESWWVKDELRKAYERERQEARDIVVPVLFDRYLLDGWRDGLASELRSRKAADLTDWARSPAALAKDVELIVRALQNR